MLLANFKALLNLELWCSDQQTQLNLKYATRWGCQHEQGNARPLSEEET